MADIFQGSALPDVKTTTATATQAPDYFTNYLSGIAGAGATALAKPADQLVAPLTELQQQGYAAVPAAATAYKPGLSAAEQTAATAAQGATPQAVQQFMNPYTSGVVDEMARLQQQNLQRNLLPSLKAGFVGTGALGSQRYAGALGQSLADMQANLTGQQTSALQKGYADAVSQAIQNAQVQNQGAQTQGTLAGQEQALGLTGAGALTKAGAEQQAQQQAIINAPLTQATNVSNLLKGYQVPSSTTQTYTGPLPGAYANSPLSQIAGLGTLLGSAFNQTVDAKGNVVNNPFGTQFVNWIKGVLPSGTDVNNNPINDWFSTPNNLTSTTTPVDTTSTTGSTTDTSGNAVV